MIDKRKTRVSSQVPTTLLQTHKHHAISASHRRETIMAITEYVELINPDLIICSSSDVAREKFVSLGCDIIALCPVHDTNEDLARAQNWEVVAASCPNVTIAKEDNVYLGIHNMRLNRAIRSLLRGAARPVYVGIDVGYYTQGHELAVLPAGTIVINYCQDHSDAQAAHQPGQIWSNQPSSEYGVISVKQHPENVAERYEHTAVNSSMYNSGVIEGVECTELTPCSEHDHVTYLKAFTTVDWLKQQESMISALRIHLILRDATGEPASVTVCQKPNPAMYAEQKFNLIKQEYETVQT